MNKRKKVRKLSRKKDIAISEVVKSNAFKDEARLVLKTIEAKRAEKKKRRMYSVADLNTLRATQKMMVMASAAKIKVQTKLDAIVAYDIYNEVWRAHASISRGAVPTYIAIGATITVRFVTNDIFNVSGEYGSINIDAKKRLFLTDADIAREIRITHPVVNRVDGIHAKTSDELKIAAAMAEIRDYFSDDDGD